MTNPPIIPYWPIIPYCHDCDDTGVHPSGLMECHCWDARYPPSQEEQDAQELSRLRTIEAHALQAYDRARQARHAFETSLLPIDPNCPF